MRSGGGWGVDVKSEEKGLESEGAFTVVETEYLRYENKDPD